MNIGHWISKRARLYPEGPFLRDEENHIVLNNAEFDRRVNQMSHALMDMGLKQGDRLALLMSNSSMFLEIFFACAKSGIIMVPVNFRLAAPELIYILQDSAPMVLIYSSELTPKVDAIKTDCLSVKHYFCHGQKADGPDPDIALFSTRFPQTEPAALSAPGLDDPLFIMYTSGTMGDPKGAALSHGNILFGSINSLLGYGVNNTFKSLVVAPMFHMGALGASVCSIIYAGGSLVLKSFYNASEIIKLIIREKINFMFAVPVMFQLMARSEEWNKSDFSHVRFFISGGAPIPVSVIRKYQEEKGISFAQGYAMTETGRITSLDLEDSITMAGSVGKEVFHTDLRIVDPHGHDVAAGETGEIWVRGPNVFKWYWNKPRETREAMSGEWFHTGDMGRRDEKGFIYIAGRREEIIISSGENIYPAEVERVIQGLPHVKEAAVIAMPEPDKRGEVVAAFVTLQAGRRVSEEEIISGLDGKIASFKIPKRIFFLDDFPRNAAGKILKKDLGKYFP
jgi:fatty-acyl-CoA synthase